MDCCWKRGCSVSCRIRPSFTNVTFWVVTAIMIFVSAMVMLSSFVDFFIVKDQNHKELNTKPKWSDRRCPLHQILLYVLGHRGPLHLSYFSINYDDWTAVGDIPNWFFNYIIINGFFCVDSFFFLSGLLLSYLFFKEIFRNPNRWKNPTTWVLFYVHRFLRLTPST
ncbi:hypothetical protein L596_016860 [Steinernema carpocapsae]|uniref:Acyltransferase 3 domain-containing protein n=1 Tax=Steinernema carpocapsae TaxID=34508 RepID=A0A4U5NJ58_STECR|nr:hypothetical protein L596_016860 [Steinernema carpocapsae]